MRLPVAKKKPVFENTIPLINVVFLILIFFLLAGTLTTQDAREIKPPETARITESEVPDGALFMAADGALKYRGEVVAVEDAVQRFASAAAQPSDGSEPMKIFADRAASAKSLMSLVEQLNRAEVKDVVLITLRKGAQ